MCTKHGQCILIELRAREGELRDVYIVCNELKMGSQFLDKEGDRNKIEYMENEVLVHSVKSLY